MDSIYQINDLDKALIFSEQNRIMILFLPLKRGSTAGVLKNDFRAHLRTSYYSGKIYYTYESKNNEIVYDIAGRNNKTIIFADKSNVWKIVELRLIVVKEQICTMYMIYNELESKCEIRIVGLEDTKKSIYKVHKFDYDVSYEFITVDGKLYLKVREKQNYINSKFYMMDLDNLDEDSLIEYCFCKKSLIEQLEDKNKELINKHNKDIAKVKKEFIQKQKEIILQKEEQEEELRKSFEARENMKMQINRIEDDLRKKYEHNIKMIMKQSDINVDELRSKLMLEHEDKYKQINKQHNEEIKSVIKQYKDLQTVATEIQNEGKRWRELYIKTLKKRGNTVDND